MIGGDSMERGDLRMAGVERGRALGVFVDGAEVRAYEGESIAAALAASGRRFTRWTARTGEPRGYFCGMGVCQDCLVTVDGLPNVRACVTPVRDGMRVESQRGLGDWRVTP
jgi:predicted molibdopterin-dependent oxidoreductase YjgC